MRILPTGFTYAASPRAATYRAGPRTAALRASAHPPRPAASCTTRVSGSSSTSARCHEPSGGGAAGKGGFCQYPERAALPVVARRWLPGITTVNGQGAPNDLQLRRLQNGERSGRVSADRARHPERASLDLAAARTRLSGAVQPGPAGTRLRVARRCDHRVQSLTVAGIAVGQRRP